MTRFRKTILASALTAAALTASTPAHAYPGFAGLLGGFFGYLFASEGTGTLRSLDL